METGKEVTHIALNMRGRVEVSAVQPLMELLVAQKVKRYSAPAFRDETFGTEGVCDSFGRGLVDACCIA